MGGLAAFASIALLTTGFAVWVVGANKTTDKGDVGVTVDTAKNESIVFKFNLDSTDSAIELKEDGPKTGNMVHTDAIEGTSKPLQIKYSASTIKFGAGYDFKYKSIVFSIEEPDVITENQEDYASVKVAGKGELTGTYAREVGAYTYLVAPKPIALPDYTKETSGTTTIDIIGGTLDFAWGTFYGTEGKSPADFYNEKFNAADEDEVAAHADEVEKEYAALTNAFAKEKNSDGTVKTWKKLKLVATLSEAEAA